MAVEEHRIELGGAPVFYRLAGDAHPPVLYVHGAPTSSNDFLALLERTGGVAPDMPGFGRSAKAVNLTYTLDSHADFIGDLLDQLGVDRVALVGHAGGAAAGLVFAQRAPERVDRLVLIDPLPLFPFHRSRREQLLRTRGLGELAMGSVTRKVFTRMLRQAAGTTPEIWTDERVADAWEMFDQGTQRAILRLLRDSDDHRLQVAGASLGDLQMPALLIWGDADPWLPVALATQYTERLPHAELRLVPGAGHWPWLEDPAVADAVADYVT